MSLAARSTPAPTQDEVEYPSSDGQPMGETGLHVKAILLLFEALLDALPEADFVAADMFWYWEQGHPESCVAPDVMVVRGVGRADRRSFFTWLEGGAVPCIVFEMASQGTWREDQEVKLPLYERLGVREYVLFDPEGAFLRPPLMGYRLVEGRYAPIAPEEDGRLRSEELGLWLRAEGLMVRLLDGTTGAPLPTQAEWVEQERLRVEQERLRAEQERLRAEQQQLRAEQERQRAEQERLRADGLAAEVERLKMLLEQARGGSGASGSAD